MRINVIIGPTASGKSALALKRCLQDGGIIINADAMQCYDALPILTAQPSDADKNQAEHRLYGTLKSTHRMSAPDWAAMASTLIEEAAQQNRACYVVGGTGLYIKALMDGLSPMPDIPDDVRARVRARLHTQGLPAIYAELERRDTAMAAKLKSGDTQRILRAMEVLEATSQSLSHWQSLPPKGPPAHWAFHVTQLRPPRERLEKNIRTRLAAMLEAGALEEVEKLANEIDNGITPADAPITIAHGFKALRAHLQGQSTLEDALEATAIETRQYTKRQRTWLRHQIRADEIIE